MALEQNIAEFWDAVAANVEWEGSELNEGHQLRVKIPCIDGKSYAFDYFPKKRKVTLVGSTQVYIVGKNNTIGGWISSYIRKKLKAIPVKKFKRQNETT